MFEVDCFLWLSMVVELFLCPEMLGSTKNFGFFDYKIRTIPTLEPYVVFKDNSFALVLHTFLKITSTLTFHSGTVSRLAGTVCTLLTGPWV